MKGVFIDYSFHMGKRMPVGDDLLKVWGIGICSGLLCRRLY